MIARDTLELEQVVPSEELLVGVIGASPGAGATTVCRLLEMERARKGEPVRVLDLGEIPPERAGREKPHRLLVVADGRESELPEGLEDKLKRLQEEGYAVGLVYSRGPLRDAGAEIPVPVFCVPELHPGRIKDLYNFAFYS